MKQYIDHVKNILTNGVTVTDRTGVGTRSIVGAFLTFNLQEGFPIVTAKRTHFLGLALEMFWFLSGTPYITKLKEAGIKIWNQWAVDESIDYPRSPATLLQMMLKAQSLPGYLATYKRTTVEITEIIGRATTAIDTEILTVCREIHRYLKVAGHTAIYEKAAVTELTMRIYQAYLECDDEVAVKLLGETITENKGVDFESAAATSLEALLTQMGAAGYVSEFHESLGPVYGVKWRRFVGMPTGVAAQASTSANTRSYKITMAEIDQIEKLMSDLDKRPYSRRHIVSAWDPRYLPDESMSPQENVKAGKMALAPCHKDFQVVIHDATIAQRKAELRRIYTVDADYATAMVDYPTTGTEAEQSSWLTLHNVPTKALYLHLNLRSSDTFLGLPYNIAQYALLAELIAKTKNMISAQLTVAIVDAHIYSNHLDLAAELVNRPTYPLPRLKVMTRRENLWDYTIEDLDLVGYTSGPIMNAPVAV